MSALFEIGFKYDDKKEATLVRAINKAITEMFPNNPEYRLSKVKNASILKGYLPFEYVCKYGVLMKKFGLYLDLYPNIDNKGMKKFNELEYTWIMFVNSLGFYSTDTFEIINEDNPNAVEYIEELCSKIPYSNSKIHSYKFGEERL